MNERRLRIFFELAQTLNMTKVAGKLYISQPAVSKAIRELEAELGLRLFERLGKKLSLTYAGEVFFRYVQRLLNIYDESLNTLRDIGSLNRGRLKIGASTTIGIYLLPEIIGQFNKQYQGVDVAIIIENTRIIAEMILDNRVDFAFVEGPIHFPEIVVEDFCSDRLVMIAAPDHAWAKNGAITFNALAEERLIMREPGSGTREVFESVLNSRGVACNIAFELGNTEAIKNAVAAGLGVSCISERCIAREVTAGRLIAVNIEGVEINRRFHLIYHRDKYLSVLFKAFIDFARQVICAG